MRAARNGWFVLLASLMLGGCATTQHSTPPDRNPYRSATLNVDFQSAYPRSVSADPFGLSSEDETRTNAYADRTQRPTPRPEPAARPEQVAAASPAPSVDSIYDPESAAAYVHAVYQANETAVTGEGRPSEVIDIYRHSQEDGQVYHSTRPAVGDLVFFHNTFDRNGDGRANDWYTHVGMVESLDDDGNIAILSYLDGRVSRTHLNLERPNDARDDSDGVINTAMRQRRQDDAAYTQYLASELFAGFGSLLGEREEFLVIDNWQPGMSVAQQ